jgi:hypothetical protein
MTVIVSVKINDGIVMAADSVSSYNSGMSYQHAIKIVNLIKGLPVGAMVTGNGGIGKESMETLLKDLRSRFAGLDVAHPTWRIDPNKYTMKEIAERVREFVVQEKIAPSGLNTSVQLRLCGYSADRPLSEIWDVNIIDGSCAAPSCIGTEDTWGLNWAGEYEPLDRLIYGMSQMIIPTSVSTLGVTQQEAQESWDKLVPHLYQGFVLSDMPIQDAIDLARFMVSTTVGFVKFATSRPHKTVGGPIEIATITKHEGFKWVQRKHFYPPELN